MVTVSDFWFSVISTWNLFILLWFFIEGFGITHKIIALEAWKESYGWYYNASLNRAFQRLNELEYEMNSSLRRAFQRNTEFERKINASLEISVQRINELEHEIKEFKK